VSYPIIAGMLVGPCVKTDVVPLLLVLSQRIDMKLKFKRVQAELIVNLFMLLVLVVCFVLTLYSIHWPMYLYLISWLCLHDYDLTRKTDSKGKDE